MAKHMRWLPLGGMEQQWHLLATATSLQLKILFLNLHQAVLKAYAPC